MCHPSATLYLKVGEHLFDPDAGQLLLFQSGEIEPEVKVLEPLILELLQYFIHHRGEVVSKDQLAKDVWKEGVASDAAIMRAIGFLRKVLGDSHKTSEYLKTIPKKGYCFIAPVLQTPEMLQMGPKQERETQKTQAIQSTQPPFSLQKTNANQSPRIPNHLRFRLTTATLIPLGICLCLFVLFQIHHTLTSSHLLKTKPTQLTAKQGLIRYPAISPNGRELLYCFQMKSQDSYSLFHTRMDGMTNELITRYGAAPQWRDADSFAYFQSHPKKGCQIMLAQRNAEHWQIHPITPCALSSSEASMDWTEDKDSLYFVSHPDGLSHKPIAIYQYDMDENETKQLTKPPEHSMGDVLFQKHPQNNDFIFIRQLDNNHTKIFAYHATLQQARFIQHHLGQPIKSLQWLNDNEVVLILESGVVKKLDINQGHWLDIETIAHPYLEFSTHDKHLIAIRALKHSSQILQLQNPFEEDAHHMSPMIATTRWLQSPVLSSDRDNLLYLSSQNGVPQLWRNTGSHYQKISSWENAHEVLDLIWYDEDTVLINMDGNLRLFDLKTEQFTNQPWQTTLAVHPTWLPDSQQLYYQQWQENQWQLIQYDVSNNQINTLYEDISSYAISSSGKEVFITYPGEAHIHRFKIGQRSPSTIMDIKLPIQFGDNAHITQNHLYYLDTQAEFSTLYQLDLNNGKTKARKIVQRQLHEGFFISRDEKTLIFTRNELEESELVRLSRNGLTHLK